MQDERDTVLVIGDPQAVGPVALDPEGLLCQHPPEIDGVHVRQQQDPARAAATKAGQHGVPDPVGRVLHVVDVGRLDQLHLAAELAKPAGDNGSDAGQPVKVPTPGLDRHQLPHRFDQRVAFLPHTSQNRVGLCVNHRAPALGDDQRQNDGRAHSHR